MAESLKGMKRTRYCGTFTLNDEGKTETICGWVNSVRRLGALTFIEVRDRTGIMQMTFDENTDAELFKKANTLRSEYVVSARGAVRHRSSENNELPTGKVELEVKELRILSSSLTPPFEIEEECNTNETTRLKYRFLDLRRPNIQRNIMLRHKVGTIAHDYFDEQGFLEIETPMLIKSTPEGARDYVVPSRVHPGSFYALPQSPQLYKQILMLSGYDRYMQIARCFRDEDLRADRQPEFTQIDLEMSFVDEDDIMTINEGFIKRAWKEAIGVEVETPFMRMPWKEAMERYGSDKPDIRFGFEIKDLTEILKNTEFKVFAGAIENGGSVRAININGYADKFPRREIDKLTEFVKTYRAKGLAFARSVNGEESSSFFKFLKEEEIAAVKSATDFKDGDLLLVVADAKNKVVFDSLGALRCEIANRLGLCDPADFKFLWVTEFPLLEWSEEENRFTAMHHPFTAPMEEDWQNIDSDPGSVRARAYDIVLNGTEMGGGSIRIYDAQMQEKMFTVLGFTTEQAEEKFGFLLSAFKYGVPPHGGMAYGFDRMLMLMTGAPSIRDVIAFPKVQNASELMTEAPGLIDDKQLKELCISIDKTEE